MSIHFLHWPSTAFLPVTLLCSTEHVFVPDTQPIPLYVYFPLLPVSTGLSSGRRTACTQPSLSLKMYHSRVVFSSPFPPRQLALPALATSHPPTSFANILFPYCTCRTKGRFTDNSVSVLPPTFLFLP